MIFTQTTHTDRAATNDARDAEPVLARAASTAAVGGRHRQDAEQRQAVQAQRARLHDGGRRELRRYASAPAAGTRRHSRYERTVPLARSAKAGTSAHCSRHAPLQQVRAHTAVDKLSAPRRQSSERCSLTDTTVGSSLAVHLEEEVEVRTAEVKQAMSRLQDLLHQILPPSVAVKLSAGETVEPEYFDRCAAL